MTQKSTILMVVLLVVGLGIGGGIGYFAAPKGAEGEQIIVEVPVEVPIEVHPLDGETFMLGGLISSDPHFEACIPMCDLMVADTNEYLAKLGYDIQLDYMLDSGQGSIAIALEKAQSYHAMGVDNLFAMSWSGATSGMLSYLNDNDMLMFSCYTTSPLLSIPDDNLFRLVPNDFQQGPVDAKMVWEYGIDAVVCMWSADAYGDGLYNVFAKSYVDDWGGVLLEKAQCRRPVGETDYSTYLDVMNTEIEKAIPIYGKNHVGVFMVSGTLYSMSQVTAYPTLMEIPWFGTDATGRAYQAYTDAPTGAIECRVFSTMPTPAYSSKMWDVVARYEKACGIAWQFRWLSTYDTGQILMKCALDTASMDAIDIVPILIDVSSSHFGAVGWCLLDETGDMPAMVYDIWGYAQNPEVAEECYNVRYGTWSAVGDAITWDIDIGNGDVSIPGNAPRVNTTRGDPPVYEGNFP